MNGFNAMPNREADTAFLASKFRQKENYGLLSAVANHFGCDPSVIHRQYDINNSLKAWFGQYKRFQWALDLSDLETGDAVWTNLSEDRRQWRAAIERDKAGSRRQSPVDLTKLIGHISKQHGEFIEAMLAGKPRHIQTAELDDVIRECQAVRDEINKEEEGAGTDKVLGLDARKRA